MAVRRVAALLGVAVLAGCSPVPPAADRAEPPQPSATASPASPEPAATPAPATPVPASEVVGRVDAALAPEVSGIDVGESVDGLWLVDDEPGTDSVHLVGLDGTLRATVRLTGVDTVNVEDLAVGPCAEDPTTRCVHVADIGDNVAARRDVVVLSFPEVAARQGSTTVTPSVRRLRLEQPVDAEAFVVLDDGTFVVVDRSPDTAGVHVAAPDSDQLLRVAEVVLPAPELPLRSLVAGRVVTAADLAPDGRTLVLRTYDQLLALTPPDDGADVSPTTWGRWDVTPLPVPQAELQGEAVALLDADRVVTMSEGSPAITVTTRRSSD